MHKKTKKIYKEVNTYIMNTKKCVLWLKFSKGIGMKGLNISDRTHEANIVRLVKEFGIRKEKRIREVYQTKREFIENNSSAIDFSPIITYKKVRESLMR